MNSILDGFTVVSGYRTKSASAAGSYVSTRRVGENYTNLYNPVVSFVKTAGEDSALSDALVVKLMDLLKGRQRDMPANVKINFEKTEAMLRNPGSIPVEDRERIQDAEDNIIDFFKSDLSADELAELEQFAMANKFVPSDYKRQYSTEPLVDPTVSDSTISPGGGEMGSIIDDNTNDIPAGAPTASDPNNGAAIVQSVPGVDEAGNQVSDNPDAVGPIDQSIIPDSQQSIPDSISLIDEEASNDAISDTGNKDTDSDSLSQKQQSVEPAGRARVQDILPALTSPIGLLGLLGRFAAPFVSDADTAPSNKANTGSRSEPITITTTDTPSVEVNPVSSTAAQIPYSINLEDPNKLPLRTAGASYIDNDGNERRYTWSQANIIPAGANGYQILSMMNNHRMLSTPEYKARRQEYRDLVRSGDPAAIRAYEEELRAQFDAGTTLDFDQTREAQRRSWAQQEYQRQNQTQNNWTANNVATPYSRAYNRSQQRPAQPQYPQSQQQPYQNAGYSAGAGNPTAQTMPQPTNIYIDRRFTRINPDGTVSAATYSGQNPPTVDDFNNHFNAYAQYRYDNYGEIGDIVDAGDNYRNMVRANKGNWGTNIANINQQYLHHSMQPFVSRGLVKWDYNTGNYVAQPGAQFVGFDDTEKPFDWANVHRFSQINTNKRTTIAPNKPQPAPQVKPTKRQVTNTTSSALTSPNDRTQEDIDSQGLGVSAGGPGSGM